MSKGGFRASIGATESRPFGCNPRFMIVLSDRTTRQADQVPHADPVGDFPQFRRGWPRRSGLCAPIAAELFHPVLPCRWGAQTQPLEDPGQGSSEIEAFPGERVGPIFDQIDVAQRKALHHTCAALVPCPAGWPAAIVDVIAATRSDTSVPQTHQPIWIGRSPSRKSPGAAILLYVMPVGPSRSCSLLVVKNHHRDRPSQHRPRARAAESALYVIKQEIYILIIISYIRIGCPGDIVYVSPDPRTFGPVMAFVNRAAKASCEKAGSNLRIIFFHTPLVDPSELFWLRVFLRVVCGRRERVRTRAPNVCSVGFL